MKPRTVTGVLLHGWFYFYYMVDFYGFITGDLLNGWINKGKRVNFLYCCNISPHCSPVLGHNRVLRVVNLFFFTFPTNICCTPIRYQALCCEKEQELHSSIFNSFTEI